MIIVMMFPEKGKGNHAVKEKVIRKLPLLP